MAYSDMFQYRRTPQAEDNPNETDFSMNNGVDGLPQTSTQQPMPQPAVPDIESDSAEDDEQLMTWQGFTSPHPFLIDKPTAYEKRLVEAANTLMQTTDGTPAESRIFWSPAITLPFLIMQNNDKVSDDTALYPLMYTPVNHPYQSGEDADLYLFTLICSYSISGFIYEADATDDTPYTNGDLISYPVTDPYRLEIDDQLWTNTYEWAKTTLNYFAQLNLARFAMFANQDNNEMQAFNRVMHLWQMDGTNPDQLLTLGDQAARMVGDSYELLTDHPFQPFAV